ncbi:hypothetical protein BVRB_1g012200 [Beta vulgaris subsp. vulgaris]|nr:hypothetical protein BVRB_1g012200 [Beta vulgaris subsp. vulgaris]
MSILKMYDKLDTNNYLLKVLRGDRKFCVIYNEFFV